MPISVSNAHILGCSHLQQVNSFPPTQPPCSRPHICHVAQERQRCTGSAVLMEGRLFSHGPSCLLRSAKEVFLCGHWAAMYCVRGSSPSHILDFGTLSLLKHSLLSGRSFCWWCCYPYCFATTLSPKKIRTVYVNLALLITIAL